MKSFEVVLEIRSLVGTVVTPLKNNPVQAESLQELLAQLATNFPQFQFGLEVTGISVREAECP